MKTHNHNFEVRLNNQWMFSIEYICPARQTAGDLANYYRKPVEIFRCSKEATKFVESVQPKAFGGVK